MASIKEIIRLKEGGLSQREIADVEHCSLRIVSQTIKAAKEKGVDSEALAEMNDKTARQLLLNPQTRECGYYLPDWEKVDEKLKSRGVNLSLVWDEYIRTCVQGHLRGYQYSQFCKLYNEWKRQHKRPARLTRRIKHNPARVLEVDWAGDKTSYIDYSSGEIRNAYLFVACLPYSQRIYVEAFDDMSAKSWLQAHINTFTYNKGVTLLVTPDNCKTAVQTPDYYDPLINKDYARLAAHYGCSILPARPVKPKDKASAENAVKFIETWVIAYLRNEKFFSLGELNRAVRERIDTLNAKPFQGLDYSRNDVFADEEKVFLSPLPAHAFELCEWRMSKVNIDYCIQVERQKYSVPYHLVGQSVDVRIGARTVEVFQDNERICSHSRLFGQFNQSSIFEDHMPDEHKLYAQEWNPERLKKWAASVGVSCYAVIDAVLNSKPHPAMAYRTCLGILGYAKKQGNAYLEELCKTALATSSNPSYKQIKMLAKKNADISGGIVPDRANAKSIGERGLTRGADDFRLEGSL